MNSISRRQFLTRTGSGLTLAAVVPGVAARAISSAPQSEKKVLVIGAGLAGLACAYDLKRSGFDVILIEARGRPGGRVRTYRDPFADGLYVEMGAEYIDSSDRNVRNYCRQFNLKILTANLYDGIYLRDRRYAMSNFKNNGLKLPYDGVMPGKLFANERQYIQPWLDMIEDINDLPEEVLALDNLSMSQLMRKVKAPKDIVDLYTYTNATESTIRPDQVNALGVVLGHYRAAGFSEDTNEGRILGGNDQLPKRFAQELTDQLHYGRTVKRILVNSSEVEVWYEKSGRLTSVTSPRLVIAMPFSVLRKTQLQGNLPADKMRCIRELQYGHVMKIAMQFKKRFWDEPGSLGQRIFTDTQLRRVYHFSIDQPGSRGILLSFTSGDDARKLGQMKEKKRLRRARQTVNQIWSESDSYWEKGVSKYWNEDPFTQGSYSSLGVGQAKTFRSLAARQEGIVHFAGEHTSGGSMEGAIASGLRVSAEVKQSVGG